MVIYAKGVLVVICVVVVTCVVAKVGGVEVMCVVIGRVVVESVVVIVVSVADEYHFQIQIRHDEQTYKRVDHQTFGETLLSRFIGKG